MFELLSDEPDERAGYAWVDLDFAIEATAMLLANLSREEQADWIAALVRKLTGDTDDCEDFRLAIEDRFDRG